MSGEWIQTRKPKVAVAAANRGASSKKRRKRPDSDADDEDDVVLFGEGEQATPASVEDIDESPAMRSGQVGFIMRAHLLSVACVTDAAP